MKQVAKDRRKHHEGAIAEIIEKNKHKRTWTEKPDQPSPVRQTSNIKKKTNKLMISKSKDKRATKKAVQKAAKQNIIEMIKNANAT